VGCPATITGTTSDDSRLRPHVLCFFHGFTGTVDDGRVPSFSPSLGQLSIPGRGLSCTCCWFMMADFGRSARGYIQRPG